MPTFPAAAARQQYISLSCQFLDLRGYKKSAMIRGGADATAGNLDGLRTAIANGSNAALISDNRNTVDAIINLADPALEVYDEAYPSVDNVAVFVFQDSTGRKEYLSVPAPDASMFEADMTTVRTADGLGAAIVTNALVVLNASDPVGTFAYQRGYLTTRASKSPRSNIVPPIVEPGVGDVPGDNPGV